MLGMSIVVSIWCLCRIMLIAWVSLSVCYSNETQTAPELDTDSNMKHCDCLEMHWDNNQEDALWWNVWSPGC